MFAEGNTPMMFHGTNKCLRCEEVVSFAASDEGIFEYLNGLGYYAVPGGHVCYECYRGRESAN
jgi:hypothetical protein